MRTAAALGGEHLVRDRIVDHADLAFALVEIGHRHGKVGHPGNEVGGAVDRVDAP